MGGREEEGRKEEDRRPNMRRRKTGDRTDGSEGGDLKLGREDGED